MTSAESASVSSSIRRSPREDGSAPDLAESALTENCRRLVKALRRGMTTQFIGHFLPFTRGTAVPHSLSFVVRFLLSLVYVLVRRDYVVGTRSLTQHTGHVFLQTK